MNKKHKTILTWSVGILSVLLIGVACYSYVRGTNKFIEQITANFRSEQEESNKKRASLEAEIEVLNNEDQRKINKTLVAKMDDLTELFKVSLGFYKIFWI